MGWFETYIGKPKKQPKKRGSKRKNTSSSKSSSLLGLSYSKEKKRRTLKRNRARGRAGEIQGSTNDWLIAGWSSKRTGKGSDYKQTRVNLLTGKKQTRLVDYKTGKAKLSKLQKKKKAKKRVYNPFPPY